MDVAEDQGQARRRIIVYHTSYGCDTGCCGHTVEIIEPWGDTTAKFFFEHPGRHTRDGRFVDETYIQFAMRLVKQEYGEDHVADLNWEHCEVSSS